MLSFLSKSIQLWLYTYFTKHQQTVHALDPDVARHPLTSLFMLLLYYGTTYLDKSTKS